MSVVANANASQIEAKNTTSGGVKRLLTGVAAGLLGYYLMKPNGSFIGSIVLLGGVLMIVQALKGLMGSGIAFSYNAQGISFSGLFGRKSIEWQDVRKISIYTLSTYALGFFKTSSRHSIRLHTKGGLFGRKIITVPTQMVGLSLAELQALAARFELFRQQNAQNSDCPAGSDDSSEADATGTRYLARKAEADARTPRQPNVDWGIKPSSPKPSFGKRIL